MVNDQHTPIRILKCFQDSKRAQLVNKLFKRPIYDLKGKYLRSYEEIRACLTYELKKNDETTLKNLL